MEPLGLEWQQLPLQPEEPQGTHPRWRSPKPWSAGPPVTGATDVKCPMVMYINQLINESWLHNNQPMFIGLTGRMHVCIQRKSSGLCVFFLLGPGQLNQYLSDTAGVYKGNLCILHAYMWLIASQFCAQIKPKYPVHFDIHKIWVMFP